LNVDAPREKPESVGKPLPDFAAELRNESGKKVGADEIGELFLRGPGMLDAYLAPWRLRDEVLENGWFRSGDLGKLDVNGCLTLVGRAHSVINVAGMKCFPEEIEAVLCGHPEIQFARVVAKPHPKFGSVPVAELVARDPAHPPPVASILAHCRNALARYKQPVEFHFVESLPKTASGKIKR
jgi:long-chain acyl-CoA synthetase